MFEITTSARTRLDQMLAGTNQKVRIEVTSGGCAGFKHHLSITNEIREDDVISEGVVVDTESLDLLGEFIVDFVEDDLNGSYFKLDIKQAKSRCGCQSSFSI